MDDESISTAASATAEGMKPQLSNMDASSNSDVKPNSELNMDSLAMDESQSVHKTLSDPDDANIEAVTSGDTLYKSAKRFEDLNLTPELLKGLYVDMKFERPSKIQEISLPMILTPPNKNLIAQAHNGSGKTTCFVLGMLSRVDPKLVAPQALCICPTRELAIQNMEVLLKMGKYTGITSELAIPADAANYVPINKRPPVTAQVIIGTPGTINKWVIAKKLGTSYMKILVFDEADHMLAESGFQDDSIKIMKAIVRGKADCQAQKVGQTIIFVRTRNSAHMLHKSLVDYGYEVTTIQGALKQEDRDKIIKEFKEGLTQVLISTDLLARGFDQSQVNLVVNYDLPVQYGHWSDPDYEVYLHRIGRAGRFGRKGAVFNLLCNNTDTMLMSKIENHFNSPVAEVTSWESDTEFEAALKTAGLL
nr:DEAD-box ATP-dependent RNA helicase 38 [Ipomoea batatas]GME18263.1 DEAD-box ATP-dependent RNA helicase 38 [Ipomoea batatas]